MSSKHQDLWLWTFLGVFGFYAARAVHIQLQAMRATAQITKIDRPQERADKGVEIELKIETLWQLTRSANQEIRAASIKLITDQVTQGRTYNLILQDIAGEDSNRREKALACLNFLSSYPAKFPAPLFKTYQAIFACLRSLHSEMLAFEVAIHEKWKATGNGTSRRNGTRQKPSRDALTILAALLQQNCRDAVRAGLISWLVEYPFGGNADSLKEKKTILWDINSWYFEDPAMYTIVNFAKTDFESRKLLVQHGLVDKPKDSFEGEVDSEWMWTGSVEGVVEPTMRGGRRMREESVEEQALRRRRREAMVLGEIGRPIERADIIERRNTGQDEEEIGREQEEPITDTREVEDVRERSWWNWYAW